MSFPPASPFARNARRRQSRWKASTTELSEAARAPGRWQDVATSFILPIDQASETLWAPIRDDVIKAFRRDAIIWHEGDSLNYGSREAPGPSPHLLDSQVACLNFWWGISQRPLALAMVLRTVFPDLDRMVAPVPGSPLLAPEWIGTTNYLGEADTPERPRRRGEFATSADLLLAYEDKAGKRHGVLLESKYTERYMNQRWRTDRVAVYGPLFEAPNSPFRHDRVGRVDHLLIEPFYQHLRQQLLATAMEQAQELGFVTVSVLHVAPEANRAYHEGITAPLLSKWGSTIGTIWTALLRDPSRYRSLSYETAFATACTLARDECDCTWSAYETARYGWNTDGT
jgi:hypothetical protein